MVASVENLYKELKVEWVKKPLNLKKCGQILDQLKVRFEKTRNFAIKKNLLQIALTTKSCFLPTGCVSPNKAELILARDILEVGVEYSVHTKDIPAFERYMCQLKCYYYDYR